MEIFAGILALIGLVCLFYVKTIQRIVILDEFVVHRKDSFKNEESCIKENITLMIKSTTLCVVLSVFFLIIGGGFYGVLFLIPLAILFVFLVINSLYRVYQMTKKFPTASWGEILRNNPNLQEYHFSLKYQTKYHDVIVSKDIYDTYKQGDKISEVKVAFSKSAPENIKIESVK